MDLGQSVGARVAELRARRKLSQEDLAAAAGCSKSFVSQLETGKKRPGLPLLEALARALDVTPAELLRPAGLPVGSRGDAA